MCFVFAQYFLLYPCVATPEHAGQGNEAQHKPTRPARGSAWALRLCDDPLHPSSLCFPLYRTDSRLRGYLHEMLCEEESTVC